MAARLGNSIGWILRECGLVEEALAFDREAAEAGRAAGETEAEANALVNLGEDHLARGQAELTAPPLARVVELAATDDWARWRYELRLAAVRARRALATVTSDGAHEAAEGAAAAIADLRARAVAHRAGKYVVQAADLAAQLALHRGDLSAARVAIAEARATLTETPCAVVGWRLEATAAAVARAAGDHAEASAATARAQDACLAIADDLEPRARAAFLGSAAVRAARGDAC